MARSVETSSGTRKNRSARGATALALISPENRQRMLREKRQRMFTLTKERIGHVKKILAKNRARD